MRTRTVVILAVVFVGYGVFLHAAHARGQQPSLQDPPTPVVPVAPQAPGFPGVPAAPDVVLKAAMPGVPAVPPAPAASGDWGFGRDAERFAHRHDGPAADCEDLHLHVHDSDNPIVESEERSISKAEARVLRLSDIRNGGVQVQGWDKDNYSVTACKAAVGSEAKSLLSQIKLSVEGGQVSVTAPAPGEQRDWTVQLLVRTPRGADIELTMNNGPAAFYHVDGKITARAQNGPVAVSDCSGEVNIDAVNGPITFSGSGGKLRLHTENGPISVDLGAGSWNGGELVADAVNGPLTLRLPSGFQSSFLLETSDAPVSCGASICSQARKTGDDQHRRIEYGSGEPVIRLSTRNGPISVM
jgi:hypothetical protein